MLRPTSIELIEVLANAEITNGSSIGSLNKYFSENDTLNNRPTMNVKLRTSRRLSSPLSSNYRLRA